MRTFAISPPPELVGGAEIERLIGDRLVARDVVRVVQRPQRTENVVVDDRIILDAARVGIVATADEHAAFLRRDDARRSRPAPSASSTSGCDRNGSIRLFGIAEIAARSPPMSRIARLELAYAWLAASAICSRARSPSLTSTSAWPG